MSDDPQDCARLNLAWSRMALRALVAAGVKHCVVCPGSRSAPLVLAAAEGGDALQTYVHYDERGAAFFALGLALGSESPVMIITTSGTAVANLLPAVVEASQSHVPLLICSADRPPELRDTEANQTVDQVHLFGSYARWFFDVPCPTAEMDNADAFISSTVRQAVTQSIEGDPGPVHLNFMFREPLVPAASDMPPPDEPSAPAPGLDLSVRDASVHQIDAVKRCIAQAERGVLLLGQLSHESERDAVQALSRALGWPLIADVTSGVKCRAEGLPLVRYSDMLLCGDACADRLDADTILHVGGRIVSKSVARYFQRRETRTVIRFQTHSRRSDPALQATHRCVGDIEALCRWARTADVLDCAEWTAAWHAADEAISEALTKRLSAQAHDEFSLVRHLSRVLPDAHDLFLGNSLAIREWDMVGVPLASGAVVGANRGASGIDGIVASAAGVAQGRQRPLVLLMGDQSLQHDLNSLSLLRERPPITLIVFNNDGGGIFDTLPIAEHGPVSDTYFTAAHGVSFESAAKMFGLDYACVESREDFDAHVHSHLAQTRPGIIEVRTSREETRVRMTELLGLSAALGL